MKKIFTALKGKPAARLTLLTACVLSVTVAAAQIPVTSSQIQNVAATTGSGYSKPKAPGAGANISTTGTIAYTFGTSSGFTDNLKKITGFTAGGAAYTYNSGVPVTIKIRRVENAAMTGYRSSNGIGATVPVPTPRDLAYYEGALDNTANTCKIKSTYIPKMEDLFVANDITIGIDNLFANTTATNFNNIERIDVVATGGITISVPAAQGFALFERGLYDGHDPAKVALITAIDASGNPTAYATKVVQINTTDYQFTGQTGNVVYNPTNTALGNFIVMRRDSSTGQLQASDLIGAGQGIGGVLVRYSDFNIIAGTTVYGYSVLANDFPGTAVGADVLDYTNATNFPTNSQDLTGIAGNDMATVTGVVKELAISGSIYNDPNGLTDNLVNGTLIYNPASTQLYVNLVNTSNIVVGVAQVQADGSFLFNKMEFGDLTAQLSKNQGTIGSTAPAVALPTGWGYTGENYGSNNSSGTGNEPFANADGKIGVKLADVNITLIKFGIERLPVADPKTTAAAANPGGTIKVAVPVLTGSDPDDGTYTGVSLTNTIRITSAVTNGILYYNNIAVTLGQTISSYDPSLLKVDPASGLVTVTFSYSEIDAAGLPSPPALVTMPFTIAAPVSLAAFDAAKSATGKAALLSWKTASEINTAYFNIERSGDGRSYTSIGSVAAAGNSNTERTYAFTDAAPLTGTNYYRLQSTDLDGRYTTSPVRLLNFGGKANVLITPNPVSEAAAISGLEKGDRVTITSAEGRRVAAYSAASNTITISLNRLAAGIYYVNVADKDGMLKSTEQLIKQ